MNKPTYNEFIAESKRMLADALITGGLSAMTNKFEYTVMVWHHNIMQNGGFESPEKSN